MKQNLSILLIAVTALICSPFHCAAQIDTQFWFAAPSIVQEHDPNNVFLQVVTYDEEATVTISQPAQGRTLLSQRRLQSHSTYSFPLRTVANYRTTVMTAADGQVHNTGILVESTSKVTVYYAATDPNSEVYTCKGRHGLGTHFVVPMQFRHACGHNAYGSVEIVASQDATTVQIQTLVATNISATPTTVSVHLNRGETYAIRSANPNTPANQLLGGTVITSDKPIAVNTTDDSAAAGGDLDLIGEQLVPTNLAGSHYIIPANNSAGHEYAYFFAIDNAVTLYTADAAGNERVVANIAPGTPAEMRLNPLQATYVYTHTNEPFVCFHLTANENGNELSGTILPSLNCSGSQEVSYVPALSNVEANVTILTRTENTDGFLVNGSPYELTTMSFFPVPGDSTWSYCSCANLQLAGGYTEFDIKNTKGVFHLGILDNGGGACSYGFFSNFGEISLYATPVQDYFISGDTLRLHLTGADNFSQVSWTGPNNWYSSDSEPMITGISEANSGMYIVNATHSEGCDVSPDTVFVNVFNLVPESTDSVCIDDSIRMAASMNKPLVWYKNNEVIDGHESRFYTYTVTEDATFRVDGHKAGSEMINWTDTNELNLPDALSIIVADFSFDHMIIGADYVWSCVLNAPQPNTIAPKVRLLVDDQAEPIVAVPNGASITASVRFTATQRYHRLRLEVVSPKPERHLQILSMSLIPHLVFSELRHIIAVDCSEPELECSYDFIAQRWNDILFIINEKANGGHAFSAYQWYCNGVLIEGAVDSYLYAVGGLNPEDEYTCVLTLEDGTTITTCPYTPSLNSTPKTSASPRYFTTSGMEVFEPLTPGFYIRVIGDITDKIVR